MDNSIQKNNPLKQYFRQIKMYIRIPSGTSYYTPDIISFNENGEVGILPMSGQDELILKNPDALLNGEALIEVLSSCVPMLKKPRALLTNDIDALITAVRYATYNDSLETEIVCPKCKHDNIFKLDLQYALDNMNELESEYVINLDSGVSVFVKPYSFPELIKTLHSQFEQGKLVRALDNDSMADERKSAILSDAFKKLSVAKFELMAAAIIKVVDETNNVNVKEFAFIEEFIKNIDKKSADKISDLINEINQVGIKRTFIAKCEKCNHEWENDIDFNPVNFS